MIVLYFISYLFCAGIAEADPELKSWKWLIGTWEMPRPQGGYRIETWAMDSKNGFTGQDLKIVGSDTTLMENIKLLKDREGIWYIPTVPDQNQGQDIKFKLMQSNPYQFVFENPKHDFPQRITYHLKPIIRDIPLTSSKGDTIDVDVTSLQGEGIHFRFFRK